MANKNLHLKPFDNGTLIKLEIFEDYAQAWIPTFVMQSKPEIHIFDFFSGPGYDNNGVAGTPIRILNKIQEQLGNILLKKTKIVLHFNEFEPNSKTQEKYELMRENCIKFIEQNPKFRYFLTVNFYNENAENLFFKLLPLIKEYPSLVYLDQNGVKFISQEYLLELEKLTTMDFLYFVSSSYFKRLGGTPEFKKVLEIDSGELEKEEYRNIHRLVLNNIKKKLPDDTSLKLFPFSIKKGANIYGIIFGAKNYAAVDKFLTIAWKRNSINGEADFDIDEDKQKQQLHLYEEKKMTKIEKFQSTFEKMMLAGCFPNNMNALVFTYACGHIPNHAVEVLKRLKIENKIYFESRTPALTYENVFRNSNIIEYTLKKK